jgi:hypothetical protein
MLEELASSRPIELNARPLQSQILFYVKIPKDKVIKPNTKLKLSVEDFRGDTFSVWHRMEDWLQR